MCSWVYGLRCCSGHLTKSLSYQHMTPLRATTIHTLHTDGSVYVKSGSEDHWMFCICSSFLLFYLAYLVQDVNMSRRKKHTACHTRSWSQTMESVRLRGNLYISEMSDPLGWKQLPGAIPTVDMTYNKSSSLSVYVNKLSGRRTSSDYTMTWSTGHWHQLQRHIHM